MGKILDRILDKLDDIVINLTVKDSPPQGQVEVHLSPFSDQYNALQIETSRMRRQGATQQQISEYIKNHPITTTQGQWQLPTYRTPLEDPSVYNP